GIFAREHTIGAIEQQGKVADQILAVGHQPREWRTVSDDDSGLAVAGFQRRALRAATVQLNHRQAGDAGDGQAGSGVLLDWGVLNDADACAHATWILWVETEADHVAN